MRKRYGQRRPLRRWLRIAGTATDMREGWHVSELRSVSTTVDARRPRSRGYLKGLRVLNHWDIWTGRLRIWR